MWQTSNHFIQKVILSLACVLLSACASSSVASPSATVAAKIERLIIQFKAQPADPARAVQELAQKYQLGMHYERELGGAYYVAKLEPAQAPEPLQAALAQIAQDPAVISIEADLLMHTMPSP